MKKEIINKSSIYNYLVSLDKKIAIAKNESKDAPKIGIFWLCLKDGKIKIFHSILETLVFGQDYGNFIVSDKGHYVIWESLKRHNIVPKILNYEDLPRGRVAYNKVTKQYIVFHGDYIKTSKRTIKSVIKSEFKLKSNVKWESDFHYHKFKRWGY